MANRQAGNPGAGIFRPVCDTLQNEVDSNSPQKIDEAQCLALKDSPHCVMSDIHRVRPVTRGQKGCNP
jgi:hypothetical protein